MVAFGSVILLLCQYVTYKISLIIDKYDKLEKSKTSADRGLCVSAFCWPRQLATAATAPLARRLLAFGSAPPTVIIFIPHVLYFTFHTSSERQPGGGGARGVRECSRPRESTTAGGESARAREAERRRETERPRERQKVESGGFHPFWLAAFLRW